MQQSVAVLALGKRASIEMANQLKKFFSNNKIQIFAYCLEELQQSPFCLIKEDLAVISCMRALPLLKNFIPLSTPTIITRRTLSLNAIDKLMELPAGTNALLVTKNTIGITEFTETIQEIGISHITLYSFLTHDYQTCSTIKTVLLADEPEQIPSWASNIIDLGVREIELASLIEIANELNYHLNVSYPISTSFIQEIVARSERLIQTLKAVEYLHYQLDVVLNNVHDGLIVVNADFSIRFINNIARKFLGIGAKEVVGVSFHQLFPDFKKAVRPDHSLAPGENLVHLKNRSFHISLQPIKDSSNNLISSVIMLRDATEVIQMEKEVREGLKTLGHIAKYSFSDIIGESPAIVETIDNARKLAASDLNVFICGENGVGKELFAHSIHNASPRSKGPFIAANCAAFPPALLESELFGYEDGAFTGAKKGGKPGLIEQANGGTIFLDEIGDIPLEAQSRLLRIIQEKEIMRVGSTRIISVDVRIIVATNKNARDLIEKGAFRQDLFYRLFVAPLNIPPLRKRPEDIPLLLNYFMNNNHVDKQLLDQQLLEQLIRYPWPGNIRELQSLIQYASVIGESPPSFKNAILNRISVVENPSAAIPVNLVLDDLPLYATILSILCEAKKWNMHVGRGMLVKQLLSRNIPISEQSLRNKMAKLKKVNFITSGKGRQGTQITAQGEMFLTRTSQYLNKTDQ